MLDRELIIQVLGLTVVVAPSLLLLLLGGASLAGHPLNERTTGRIVQFGTVIGLLAALAMLTIMLALDMRYVPIEVGTWVVIPHYHFSIKFVFDRLSVPFVIITFALCGTIGAFARKYMHREPGFNRFFVFYVLFVLGMVVTSLAGTIETLFTGWELVGLSSALLVAFFHDRPAPVKNGLRVWAVYRISDAALLIASVAMHHVRGEGDFSRLLGSVPWPDGVATVSSEQALLIGLLLLVAAAGKSAMVPFSGWLPRAMEGPTPSSAVFYGALSVHLGAFLMLRISPLLDRSFALSASVVALGLVTAMFSSFATRVQTDIKSSLAFASLTQVGIIFVEIGCGLRYVALIHILGHACLRTLQFLRAPSILHDYHTIENAIGGHVSHTAGPWERILPARARPWFYRLALERGYLDSLLNEWFVRPFLRLLQLCDGWERRWTDFLGGSPAKDSRRDPDVTRSLEDLL